MTKRFPSYDPEALKKYSKDLLGQIYPPDYQCEAKFGNGSYLCRASLQIYSNVKYFYGCGVVCITKKSLFKYTENFTTKKWKLSDQNSDSFLISAQNIDCGTR